MKLQNNLRECRIEHGLTQEALASMVGVTRQTIIAIEKGGYTPSMKLGMLLAHSLEVSIVNLFWLTENQGVES
jgi:putative transcriptional regulator